MIINEWTEITKVIEADIYVLDFPLLDTRLNETNLVGKFISDVVLQVLSFVAQNERENIKQRQAEGIRIAKEKGIHLGRPPYKVTDEFIVLAKKYHNKDITNIEAAKILHINRGTFLKYAKKFKWIIWFLNKLMIYYFWGDKMRIEHANINDFSFLDLIDLHISEVELIKSIQNHRIYIMYDDNNKFIGVLRYNLFWDNTPFINFIFINKQYRNKGYGSKLLKYFEEEIISKKYKIVLSSSPSNELGQHFFRKNGYLDCGELSLPNEPLEIIFYKEIASC